MISKIITKPPFQVLFAKSLRQFSKTKPNFVSIEKFKDQGFLIYQSKEAFFYIGMSSVLFTYSLYHGYFI